MSDVKPTQSVIIMDSINLHVVRSFTKKALRNIVNLVVPENNKCVLILAVGTYI